jgi:hypothetical protein
VTTSAKLAALIEQPETNEEEVAIDNSFNIFYIDALDAEIMSLIRMQEKVMRRMKKILSNGSNGAIRITEDLNND